jgi:hypothetical protein
LGRDWRLMLSEVEMRGLPSTLHSCSRGWLKAFAKGKPVSPDFDVAVKRHQLLDAIQKASDTGFRQIL